MKQGDMIVSGELRRQLLSLLDKCAANPGYNEQVNRETIDRLADALGENFVIATALSSVAVVMLRLLDLGNVPMAARGSA